MGNMDKINISNLKNYRNDFLNEKDNFNDSTYNVFSSSYISTCSSSYVRRMKSKLNNLYNLIKWGYINIDDWWLDYLNNAETLENALSDNGRVGSISKAGLRNFVSNHLSDLSVYNFTTTDNFAKSLLNNTNFSNNASVSAEKFASGVVNFVSGLGELSQNLNFIKANVGLNLLNLALAPSRNKIATKEYIVEALGFNTILPEEVALGHVVYAVSGYDAEIRKIRIQIEKLSEPSHDFFAADEKDMEEQNKEQIALLEEQCIELAKTKKLVIESLADYIGISEEDFNQMLDYYDALNTNEQNQLINCNIQLLVPEIKKTLAMENTDKNLFATAATTVLTMGEKLFNTAERAVDTGAFILTTGASLGTLGYDASQAIKGAITGEKWTSKTKEMWKNNMEFISKEHVNEAFDKFYTETDIGFDIATKTYGYDKIRSFGSNVNSELIGLSFVEGVGEFGEGLVDAVNIFSTAWQSQFTLLYDGAQAVKGSITGEGWTSKTKEIWNKTKEEVSVQYVDGAFNKLYNETKYGQNIVSRAYDFENIRAVSSGIGYYSGAIILTVSTGGLGALSMPASMGVSAGVAGLGKNTEKAWSEGATLLEGLGYGAAKGTYEGLQMWAGAKINSFNPFKGATVSSQVKNTLTHVVCDGLDGLTGSIIDPGLQLIYEPTTENMEQIMSLINYDEDGNKINDKTWDDLNIFEKYSALFEYNGGVQGAMINTFIGAGLSGITEVPDIGRAIKINNIANNIDVNADITGSLLDQINVLKDDGLAKLITRCDETGKMSTVLSTLSNDKIASTLDQLDSNVLKKIVGDDMSKYISYLDDSQLKGILDKINGDETLSNLKNQIETKLESKNNKTNMTNEQVLTEIVKDVELDNTTNKLNLAEKFVNILSGEKVQQIKTTFKDIKDTVVSFAQKPSFSNLVDTLNRLSLDAMPFLQSLYQNLEHFDIGMLEFTSAALLFDSLGSLTTKTIYKNIDPSSFTYKKIMDEGLYHITTAENAKQIVESGYLKSSNPLISLGKEKVFFFAGQPTYEELQANLAKVLADDDMVAIKIKLTDEQLANLPFKERVYNDGAITYEGNFEFDSNQVSVSYLSVQKENNFNFILETPNKVKSNINVSNIQHSLQAYARELTLFPKTLLSIFENKVLVKNVDVSVDDLVKNVDVGVDDLIKNVETLTSEFDVEMTAPIKASDVWNLSPEAVNEIELLKKDIYLGEITRENMEAHLETYLEAPNLLVAFLDKVNECDIENLSSDFSSTLDFKKSILDNLQTSGKFDAITSTQLMYMTEVPEILVSLTGNEKYSSAIVKNLSNSGFKWFVQTYKNLNIEQFNSIFSDQLVKDGIENLDYISFSNLLKLFNQNGEYKWINCSTFTDKILNLSVNDFYDMPKEYIKDALQNLSNNSDDIFVLEFMEKLQSKFLTKDILYSNSKNFDKIIWSMFPRDSSNINVQKIKQSIISMKNDFNLMVKSNIIKNSAIEIPDNLIYKNVEYGKYYDLIYELNGVEYKIELDPNYGGYSLQTILEINNLTNAAVSGELKIKGFEYNYNKNKFVLDESQGIIPGLNQIKVLVDGKEQTIILKSYGKTCSLKNYLGENVNDISIISSQPIKSYNLEVDAADVGETYVFKYEIDGVLHSKYVTATGASHLIGNKNVLDVDSVVLDNQLSGITNYEISKVDWNNFKHENIDLVQSKNINIFTDQKYGGNQQDVVDIMNNFVEKQYASDIECKKGEILTSLVKKYFPDASESDLSDIADNYSTSGCSYMAFSNAFFTYIGRMDNYQTIFKEKFGFDLFFKDGDQISYNVEALAFDIYLNNVSKTGNLSFLAKENGVSISMFEDTYVKYFESKGIKSDISINLDLEKSYVSKILNSEDEFLILGSKCFDLESLEDNYNISKSDAALSNSSHEGKFLRSIGGHAMIITDFDADNNIIVSSWGSKYKYLPNSVIEYKNAGEDANLNLYKVKFDLLY